MTVSKKNGKKSTRKSVHKSNKNAFRQKAEYKNLSLFLVGTIGFLLLTYVGFALVTTSIKTEKLLQNQKLAKNIPAEVGSLRRDVAGSDAGTAKQNEKVNVIVKEVFGKISSINRDVITIETQVYGEEEKSIRLKFQDETKGNILSYVVDEKNQALKTEMEMADLKEGTYVGVALPVEILLSEIEKDLIYIDNMVVNLEYSEENEG